MVHLSYLFRQRPTVVSCYTSMVNTKMRYLYFHHHLISWFQHSRAIIYMAQLCKAFQFVWSGAHGRFDLNRGKHSYDCIPPLGENFTDPWRIQCNRDTVLLRRTWQSVEALGSEAAEKWVSGVESERDWVLGEDDGPACRVGDVSRRTRMHWYLLYTTTIMIIR